MPDFTYRIGRASPTGLAFAVVIHSTMYVCATVAQATEKAERMALEPRNPTADLATLTSGDGTVVWRKRLS